MTGKGRMKTKIEREKKWRKGERKKETIKEGMKGKLRGKEARRREETEVVRRGKVQEGRNGGKERRLWRGREGGKEKRNLHELVALADGKRRRRRKRGKVGWKEVNE